MARKGVVLIIALMVMAVILVLIGAYFSSLFTEKRVVDNERFVLQALGLAEAGLNHAQSELRERIRTDLVIMVNKEKKGEVFNSYVTEKKKKKKEKEEEEGNNSLGFLRDFAYANSDTKFTVSGDEATLVLSSLSLDTAIQVNYTAKIIVKANGAPTSPQNDVFVFPYSYIIESQGSITQTIPVTRKTVRLLQGSFTITVRKDIFAKFALFTNHHQTPTGTIVWFTANTNFTGPLHSNDRFSFANKPSGRFTEKVTQHLPTARFYNNGWPRNLNADSNPPYDVPSFCPACFNRGVTLINLPSSVTQQDLKTQATGGQNDKHWSSGIYLPNQGGSLVGGIYIKGDADNITMSVDGSRPVYTITQGENTKRITIDYGNIKNPNDDKTIVTDVSGQGGTSAGTYNGIPQGIDKEGIIVYANGGINNFSGTVQSDTNITVSSDSDIVINNHILYQSYNPGSSPDAINYNNLLGILTWNGNVRIGRSAPDDLNIHGVVMTAGHNGIFTVDNYQSGSPRGTVTLLGGVITDFYGPFGTFRGTTPLSGYGRNFVYDARMLQGLSPPYFPYMTYFTSFDDGLDNKLIWQDKGI